MSESTQPTRRPRAATIVWGVMLLVIAALAFAASVLDVRDYSVSGVIWIIIGLGGLLVVAAIISAIARTVRPAPAITVQPSDDERPPLD